MTPYSTSDGRSASTGAVAGSHQDEPRVVLLLFAAARVAAGTGRAEVSGRDVGTVLSVARQRYGSEFGAVVDHSQVWVNGDRALPDRLLATGDEVAVLPPVSGGAVGPPC